MERRRFLAASSAGLVTPSLLVSGCLPRTHDLRRVVEPGQINLPLVVDVHAHTFNGSDLQVSEFIRTVAVNEVESSSLRWLAETMGPLLQWLAWNFAPTADRELRVLDRVQFARPDESVDRLRKLQYDIAKTKVEEAARKAMAEAGMTEAQLLRGLEQLRPQSAGIYGALHLPDTYEELHEDELSADLADIDVRAGLRFLVEMFQYRHVSAVNYFDTYRASYAGVDLLTPSLVDYDWWLASGKNTESPLPQQIQVAERVAVHSGGAIHPFVPFDPFRQAAWTKLGLGGFSPVELVKEAIEKRGSVGVKLYPPMGFAIYGNAQFPSEIWNTKKGLHDLARRPDIPKHLDAALDELFSYCAAEDVAVMAHSSRSNMAHKDYERLLLAESWRTLFERSYGGHHVTASLGHFSGFGSSRPQDHWQDFVNLLIADSDADHRFADLSYFTETISDSSSLVKRIRSVLYDSNGTPTSVLNQLLYGSDWKMLLLEENAKDYLQSTIKVLEDAEINLLALGDYGGLTQRVLGTNSLHYLGLNRSGKTRNRLEAFYDRNGMSEPIWMKKADRLNV